FVCSCTKIRHCIELPSGKTHLFHETYSSVHKVVIFTREMTLRLSQMPSVTSLREPIPFHGEKGANRKQAF
ncbi:MAG: hypothetical protein LBS42_03950, partial [Tannerella sp.]|nr:hypothetical protein [Tannerella sp.]